MTSYLNFIGVSKRYGAFQAVTDFTLSIKEGELVAILGPSGCGKTTSLRMLAGFVPVSDGSIQLAGKDVTTLPAYRRDVGMVFQGYALFPHMTVGENVAFGLEMRGMDRPAIAQRVEQALRRVRLDQHMKRLPRELSGGQQQRVALARAMAINPAVLLLDEPLSALDARLRQEVRAEIRQLQKESGITTVMVTHDQDEALSMADRLVIMNHGRIEQIGTPSEVYERPANKFVAEFMGKSNFLTGQIAADGSFRCSSGEVLACPDTGDRLGHAALMSFRPERVRLSQHPVDPGEGWNGVWGRMLSATYLGPFIEYRIGMADDVVLTAIQPNNREHAARPLDDSANILVEWKVQDSRLLTA